MRKYLPLLKSAKNALILFTLTTLLSIGLITTLLNYNTDQEEALSETETTVQSKQSAIQTLLDNLNILKSHQTEFDALISLGLVGSPNRASWVEQFEAIYRELRLPLTLRYSLETPRPLIEPGTGATPAASPTNALRHELNVDLSDLHEEEFLLFIDRLNTGWKAPFRVNNCEMTRRNPTKLEIKCALRLFSLPIPTTDQNQNQKAKS